MLFSGKVVVIDYDHDWTVIAEQGKSGQIQKAC